MGPLRRASKFLLVHSNADVIAPNMFRCCGCINAGGCGSCGCAGGAPTVGAFGGAVETGDGAEMSGAAGGAGAVAVGCALLPVMPAVTLSSKAMFRFLR